MNSKLLETFHKMAADEWFMQIRVVRNFYDTVFVRNGVPAPPQFNQNHGFMISAIAPSGGFGYAASSDFSADGIKSCMECAKHWASLTGNSYVTDFSKVAFEKSQGEYSTPVKKPWNSIGVAEKIEKLQEICRKMEINPDIKYRETSIGYVETETQLYDNRGSSVQQRFSRIKPSILVAASNGLETQRRTFGRGNLTWAGGWEVAEDENFFDNPERLAEEAIELLKSPNCPEGKMGLLIAPDQMILQIHESIGHPIELDRILGDERNYAGTSFVTMDMFGKYQYGSELLNITFDPTIPEEVASYKFDDDGTSASKQHIIKDGILMRPIGGKVSSHRAKDKGYNLDAVPTSRACNWNRPPIDRMANINLEAGDMTFDQMLEQCDNGIFVKSNCSWSIDDSRNKFQFGCEYGKLIKNGKISHTIKNPNYRGISANFWRGLTGVGREDLTAVMGSPYCGKGEPNQAVFVGHKSPSCVFQDVEVFGGDQ